MKIVAFIFQLVIIAVIVVISATTGSFAGRDQYFGMDPNKFESIGAEYLSRNEVRQALAGRTEIFLTGDRAYYAPTGDLLLKKKGGDQFEGRWRVVGTGRMCTIIDGKQGYCHGYMRFKNRIYYI